jgi:AAA domain-containing protein
MADNDLIYSPAKRGNVGVLIMLAGASGSGKTKSALRLAMGLANGGPIGFCDTEHGRALYYADEFEFLHLELKEPFTPKRFETAAVVSQQAGHAVWVCDSFSHEHVGPGGILDMFNDELQRMTKGDVSKMEQLKYTAWIKPKMEHKHLLQRLWQLNAHIIICCHAEKKLDLVKDKRGRTVPNPDAGLSPVCAPDIPYAMTCSFMLDAKRPGVPTWIKHLDKLDGMVDVERPLDEATGARIAAWARGDTVERLPSRQAKTEAPPDVFENGPPDYDDDGAESDASEPAGPDPKMIAWVDDMAARFLATPDMKAHFAIVDDAEIRTRIEWLKKNEKQLYAQRLKPAIDASVTRNTPKPAGDAAPPTEELPL